MKSALIGYTGFVGSNLHEQFGFTHLYNSKNIGEIDNLSFDIVVCAGISAVKWLANKEPEADLKKIQGLISHLQTVKTERFVLVSTVDVYPVPFDVDESLDLDRLPNHAYGKNRLYVENFVKERHGEGFFRNCNIVRLPGLFGKNIKKNVIFDLLNDNGLEFINTDCSFQYYWLVDLWMDIERMIENNLSLVNFATEPIKTSEILNAFFPDKKVGDKKGLAVKYNMLTKHADAFGGGDGYMYDKRNIMSKLEKFVKSYRA